MMCVRVGPFGTLGVRGEHSRFRGFLGGPGSVGGLVALPWSVVCSLRFVHNFLTAALIFQSVAMCFMFVLCLFPMFFDLCVFAVCASVFLCFCFHMCSMLFNGFPCSIFSCFYLFPCVLACCFHAFNVFKCFCIFRLTVFPMSFVLVSTCLYL